MDSNVKETSKDQAEVLKDKKGVLKDKAAIKKIIPHREPMLLVDHVLELEEGASIRTDFYVREDWDIFKGHFPGDPVLPGVLSVECMAQAADILLLLQPRFAGTIPYFIGIDKVRFYAKIKPGDRIEVLAEVTAEKTEKSIVTCAAKVYNGGDIAAEGEVTLAMRPVK